MGTQMEVGSLWPGYRDLGSPQVFSPIGSTDGWCYFLATPSGDLAILIALETHETHSVLVSSARLD